MPLCDPSHSKSLTTSTLSAAASTAIELYCDSLVGLALHEEIAAKLAEWIVTLGDIPVCLTIMTLSPDGQLVALSLPLNY